MRAPIRALGDDCNIYVRSRHAGELVMTSLRCFITGRLKLKVNEAKSTVDAPQQRKFLGFTFTGGRPANRRKVASESLQRFKARICQLTRRNWCISQEERVRRLGAYLLDWRGYFGFRETGSVLRDLGSWIRHRLRCVQWKQWKVYRRRKAELIRLGGRNRHSRRPGVLKGLGVSVIRPGFVWRSAMVISMHWDFRTWIRA